MPETTPQAAIGRSRRARNAGASRLKAPPKKRRSGASTAPPNAIVTAELRRADELVPYPRNPRKHSDAHIAEVMGSILEFGYTNPILHDDFIRAGHARQKAVLRIYDEGKTIRLPNGTVLPKGFVPVIDCSGWSEAQKRAYVIADNKLTENAEWDPELLALELGDLKGMNFDTGLLGFSKRELNAILGEQDGGGGGDGAQLEPKFQILIECKTEADQVELLTKLTEEGVTCRALIA